MREPWSLPRLLRAVCVTTCASGCLQPAPGRTLRIAHEAELATLDPVGATDHISISVLSNIYDSLTEFDRDMRLVPALAESWSSPEPAVWVFKLRRGVRAHDGSLIEPEDVRFSIERARSDAGSSLRQLLAGVESVATGQPGEVIVRTRAQDALLARRLASVFITPRSRAATLAERPVGTGPYRFVSKAAGGLELEAFAGWRVTPSIRRVRFVTVQGNAAILSALADESLDLLRWVPEELTGQVEAIRGVRVKSRPSLRAVYLWMRSRSTDPRPGPFANPLVRRAAALAVDRKRLIDGLSGRALPLEQLVPPGVQGHLSRFPSQARDPMEARRLLARAGFADGLETTLTFHPGARNLAGPLAEILAEAGIRARLAPVDWPTLREGWQAAQIDLFLASWRFTTGEASSFFQECLSSRRSSPGASWNPGYENELTNQLVEQLSTADDEHRSAIYRRLGPLAMEDLPIIPLVVRQDLYAVREDLSWEPRADGNLSAIEMSLPAR